MSWVIFCIFFFCCGFSFLYPLGFVWFLLDSVKLSFYTKCPIDIGRFCIVFFCFSMPVALPDSINSILMTFTVNQKHTYLTVQMQQSNKTDTILGREYTEENNKKRVCIVRSLVGYTFIVWFWSQIFFFFFVQSSTVLHMRLLLPFHNSPETIKTNHLMSVSGRAELYTAYYINSR